MARAFDAEEVLTRAMELVWDVGIDGASMDALVKATGAHRGTLYKHFSSREGLMQALLRRYRELVRDTLLQPVRTSRTLDGLLHTLRRLEKTLQSPTGWRGCLAVNAAMHAAHHPSWAMELRSHRAMFEDAFCDALQTAADDGVLVLHGDARAKARFLVCCVEGIQSTVRIEGDASAALDGLAELRAVIDGWLHADGPAVMR